MPFIVVGLGNPGKRYAETRHNVGFRVVDRLAEELGIPVKKHMFEEYERGKGTCNGRPIVLVKPLTYMNESGRILRHVLRYNNATIGDLLVVCDQLDLPPGECRLKTRGSAGGHRGLASIIKHSGTQEFKRLSIGIGRPACRDDVVDYVLQDARGEDGALIDDAIQQAARAVTLLCEKDPESVMNILNRKS